MNFRNRFLRCSLRGKPALLAVLVFIAGNSITSATAAGLFQPVTSHEASQLAAAQNIRSRFNIIRERWVRIDLNEVAQHIAPLEADNAPDRISRAGALDGRITIDLFSDAAVTLQRKRIESVGGSGFAWSGEGADPRLNYGTLIVEKGQVSGFIHLRNELYKIAPVGNGIHLIAQIDTSGARWGNPVRHPSPPPNLMQDKISRDSSAPAVIRVLVAYTRGAAHQALGGEDGIKLDIKEAVASANLSYANSGVPIELELAGTMLADSYFEGFDSQQAYDRNLEALAGRGGADLKEVRQERERVHADLVQLWRKDPAALCGLADYVQHPSAKKTSEVAFASVVTASPGCLGQLSFQHELGHNMGLEHDRYIACDLGDPQGHSCTAKEYNFGYVNRAASCRYQTVMAYGDDCIAHNLQCTLIPYFSSPPNITKVNGCAIGHSQGAPKAADNSRRLRETRFEIAKYRSDWQISPLDPTVADNAPKLIFTISRADLSGQQTVFVSTTETEGFANANDYTPINKQRLLFHEGEVSKQVAVRIMNKCGGVAKTFGFIVQQNLADPADAFVAKTKFTIQDDFAGVWSINPGINFEAGGVVNFTLKRPSSIGRQSVSVSTIEKYGFSNQNDFIPLNGLSLTFNTGEAEKLISVQITNDIIPEPNKIFGITVTRACPDTGSSLVAETTFSIEDDDLWSAGSEDFRYAESDGVVNLPVIRLGFDRTPTSVFLSTTTSEGFPNDGYFVELSEQEVAFATGQSIQTVKLTLKDNQKIEAGVKRFGLVIKDADGHFIGKGVFNILTH